jgi:hypothetical protein
LIDLNWLMLLSGVLLPMLVALATAQVANSGVKALVLAVLAAVSGLANELYSVGGDLGAYDWNSGLANAVTTFLVGVGLHYGLLKPLNITGRTGVIQDSVPAGVGDTGVRP